MGTKQIGLLAAAAGVSLLALIALVFFSQSQGTSNQAANPNAAAGYPSEPIRLIVPFAQGGATDQTARMISGPLGEALGQPLVLVNQAGGGGAVGLAQAAQARPDGYTLSMVTDSNLTARPLMSNSGYTPDSFAPIARLVLIPTAIAVREDSPFGSLDELIQAGRERALSYSSPGVGSGPDLMVAAMAEEFSIQVNQVPAASGREAVLKLLSGEVDFVSAAGSNYPSMIDETGSTIRVLGMTSDERWPFLPDVPTFAEQGYDFEWWQWFGIVAPAGTPDEIVTLLSEHIANIMRDPANEELLRRFYFLNAYLGPQAFEQEIRRNTERLGPLLERIGLANP